MRCHGYISLRWLFAVIIAAFMTTIWGCGETHTAQADSKQDFDIEPRHINEVIAEIKAGDDPMWGTHCLEMPDENCVKLEVHPPMQPFKTVFRDSNYLHYAAGEQGGIVPIKSSADIWHMDDELLRIRSCEDFYIDTLKHSYPYLVPEAAQLLHDIGRSFRDSLKARGGGDYRVKVTSLLRTDQSVKRLRRVNRLAVDSSAHRFGTTFDISYIFFMCDRPGVNRTQEDLKNLLAEILYKMRQDNRCFIIFERQQACFHITTRPKDFVAPKPPRPNSNTQDTEK